MKGMVEMRSQLLGFRMDKIERKTAWWLSSESSSQSAKVVSLEASPARRSTAEFSAK